MRVEIRLTGEDEELELVLTSCPNEDNVMVAIGDSGLVVEVNMEELKLALRKIQAR